MTGYKTGLIVVDLQKAFKPPQRIVDGIEGVLKNYDVVIATQFLNHKLSLYETELGYRDCQLGSPQSEIVIPLHPAAVFDRFSYGLKIAHIEHLKTFPVQRWDICGCDTEACVLATCYNLWDNGIRFRVLKDLCASSGGDDVHNAAMAIFKRSFGQ